MPIDADAIGSHGELIAENVLTRRHGRPAPRFRPRFLGEKFPAVDFYVELVAPGGPQTPFFFAQVKATSMGYDSNGKLRVSVQPEDISALIGYPAPTYVIGVDEVLERAFIVAATVGGVRRLSSLPASYALDDEVTLIGLFDEVRSFWQTNAAAFTTSRFM